jgi:hypothetical protein
VILADVERFRVPLGIVGQTEVALRNAGAQGYEMFVLWSGRQNGSVFDVQTPHFPRQNSYRLPGGLCVRVEGEELHRLNVWLFEAGERLGVQVHAHPTDAYHSDTDNTYPIVATLGGLSIVTPDFCQHGLFTQGTAIYRLNEQGWMKQPSNCIEVV